jgi:hypothetical protein
MGGLALLAAGSGGGASSGSTTFSPTPTWSDIDDQGVGNNPPVTLSGIGGPVSISASNSGSGGLGYYLNDNFKPYTGAFTVNNGDTLSWQVQSGKHYYSGTITVTNATTSTTLSSFAYVLTAFSNA